MAPMTSQLTTIGFAHYRRDEPTFGNWRDTDAKEAFVVEGWGEGFMLGALFIMVLITIVNMRKGVLLHKVIMLELLLAMSHGTFCFMSFHGYGYYLSATAALLYCSYFTHNVVAWMKIRPFFTGPQPSFGATYSKWVRWIFLSTLAMSIPVLIFQIFNNFRYFNNKSKLYATVRPYEPLMRDPWWIFSCWTLFHVIRKSYGMKFFQLIRRSPRFGIMLAAIMFAIGFTVVDILSSIISGLNTTDGINPYWKLALVFKCLTDNILLDDFKSVLQRLGEMNLDETSTTLRRSMAINPTVTEKSHSSHDEDGLSSGVRRNRTPDHTSSAMNLEDALNDPDLGRQHNTTANGVGKLGIKIHKLPKLPS